MSKHFGRDSHPNEPYSGPNKTFREGPSRGSRRGLKYPATNEERFGPSASRYDTSSGHPTFDRRYADSGWTDNGQSRDRPLFQNPYYRTSYNQFSSGQDQSYEQQETYDRSYINSHRTGYNEFSSHPPPGYGPQTGPSESLIGPHQTGYNQFSGRTGSREIRPRTSDESMDRIHPRNSQRYSGVEYQFDKSRIRSTGLKASGRESHSTRTQQTFSSNGISEERLHRGESFDREKSLLDCERRSISQEKLRLDCEKRRYQLLAEELKQKEKDEEMRKVREEELSRRLSSKNSREDFHGATKSPRHEKISSPDSYETSSRQSPQHVEAVDLQQEFVSPGNYLTVAFDAYVWTEENLRMEHLCQLGAASSQRESFFRWIVPNSSRDSKNFPFVDDASSGLSFQSGFNQIQKVDSFVSTRKGLEDFVLFLETGCRKMGSDCDGVLLISFRRNVIPCLIMSMLDHDDLKVRFAAIVRGIGDLRTYLLECPDLFAKFHGNDRWQDELCSIHSASKLIFGEYPTTSGQCDLNSKTILNMIYKLLGFYQPPASFVRRYLIPLRAMAIRQLILDRNLARKVGKFWQLQQFVSSRLCQKENELVPVGVFNELAPERPGLLSDRLSAGLVRALIAAGLDFESLQDAMISRGVKGFEDDLRNFFLPKLFSAQPEKANQQTVRIVALVSIFFEENLETKEDVRKESPKTQTVQISNKEEVNKSDKEEVNKLDKEELKKSDENLDKLFDDLEREFRTWFGTSPELEKVVKIFVGNLRKVEIDGKRLIEMWESGVRLETFLKDLGFESVVPNDEMATFLVDYLTRFRAEELAAMKKKSTKI